MRILIAEDDATSRALLAAVLTQLGHEVVITCDGNEAWDKLQLPGAPRLAILDWLMPGADGLELCRRLRTAAMQPQPYLLILTALADKPHLVDGLEAGADDYMSKPFDRDELRARVNVASRVIAAEDRLRQENQRLESLVEERARMLLHADRLATIGVLAAGIAHEINNPATFIAGNLGVLEQCVAVITKHLEQSQSAPDERYSLALETLPKLSSAMRTGVMRIESIVNGLRRYSFRTESEVHQRFDLRDCVDSALQLCQNQVKHLTRLEWNRGKRPISLRGSEQQLVQVFVNLIVNAVDAMDCCSRRALSIEVTRHASRVTARFDDSGPGIAEGIRAHIFAPFFTTKDVGKGTGLGLSISHDIVAAHGGVIHITESPWGGASFLVELPCSCDADSEGGLVGN